MSSPCRWLTSFAVLVLALGLANCAGGSDPPVTMQHWNFQELALSYPSSLHSGGLQLASASDASSCVCHVVAPPAG